MVTPSIGPPELEISEIFDTISGEAPTAGQPATFVRLAGCPVRCATCDTGYAVYKDSTQYMRGYAKGVALGDGSFAPNGFWLQATDAEMVNAFAAFVQAVFAIPVEVRKKDQWARIRDGSHKVVFTAHLLRSEHRATIDALRQWEPRTSEEKRGFVAGFFDAEGSFSGAVSSTALFPAHAGKQVEFHNSRLAPLETIKQTLEDFGFSTHLDGPTTPKHPRHKPMYALRLRWFTRGGWKPSDLQQALLRRAELQRFFDTFQPRITRKYKWCKKRWHARAMSIEEIIVQCNRTLVVVTGGEPLAVNLDTLLSALKRAGHTTQVETSGAYPLREVTPDILVCSPKPNMRYFVHPTTRKHVSVYKFVVGEHSSGFDWNESVVESFEQDKKPIYLMPHGLLPTYLGNRLALEILERHKEWRFSPRLHVDLGVDELWERSTSQIKG